MAFTIKTDIHHLTFEGDLAGLEVDVRSGDIDQYDRIRGAAALMNAGSFEEGMTPDAGTVRALASLAGEVSSCLVGWNIETEDGQPVECSVDGWRSIGMPMQFTIILGWLSAIATVADAMASDAVPEEFDESMLGMEPLV